MPLKILQWNCQSVQSKRPELEARSNDFDMLLSETWLESQSKWLFKNFDVIREDRVGRRGGGVAVLVRNGIRYRIFKDANLFNAGGQIEVCGVVISLNSKEVTILSLYKPPQINISAIDWHRFLSQFRGKFFVGGDFNAHNIAWGSPNTCPEGQKLLDVCLNLNLTILNDGSLTRFETPHSQGSAIDLSISNSSCFVSSHWEALNESATTYQF
jgi:hypothetical protein